MISTLMFAPQNGKKVNVKVSPITCKGRMGVIGFEARHFSPSQLRDGSAYLLSVAALHSLRSKEGQYLRCFVSHFCLMNLSPNTKMQLTLSSVTAWTRSGSIQFGMSPRELSCLVSPTISPVNASHSCRKTNERGKNGHSDQ